MPSPECNVMDTINFFPWFSGYHKIDAWDDYRCGYAQPLTRCFRAIRIPPMSARINASRIQLSDYKRVAKRQGKKSFTSLLFRFLLCMFLSNLAVFFAEFSSCLLFLWKFTQKMIFILMVNRSCLAMGFHWILILFPSQTSSDEKQKPSPVSVTNLTGWCVEQLIKHTKERELIFHPKIKRERSTSNKGTSLRRVNIWLWLLSFPCLMIT